MGFWWDFSNVCLGMIIVWMFIGIVSALQSKDKKGLVAALVLSAPGFLIYMWVHLLQ